VNLIIGYGNPLRTDDAIGQHVALALEQQVNSEKAQVLTAYQLTPELVEPICRAQRVFFIDACVGEIPGTVAHERVKPVTGVGSLTHHITPSTLLGAAHELYGVTPIGVLISIVGASFDYGSELSLQLSAALPMITNSVHEIIFANAGASIQEERTHA
jgi:hydrogenase maturation protease